MSSGFPMRDDNDEVTTSFTPEELASNFPGVFAMPNQENKTVDEYITPPTNFCLRGQLWSCSHGAFRTPLLCEHCFPLFSLFSEAHSSSRFKKAMASTSSAANLMPDLEQGDKTTSDSGEPLEPMDPANTTSPSDLKSKFRSLLPSYDKTKEAKSNLPSKLADLLPSSGKAVKDKNKFDLCPYARKLHARKKEIADAAALTPSEMADYFKCFMSEETCPWTKHLGKLWEDIWFEDESYIGFYLDKSPWAKAQPALAEYMKKQLAARKKKL